MLTSNMSSNGATSYDLYIIFCANSDRTTTELKVYDGDFNSTTQFGDTTSTIGLDPVMGVYKNITSETSTFKLGNSQGRLFYVGVIYYN